MDLNDEAAGVVAVDLNEDALDELGVDLKVELEELDLNDELGEE